MIQLLYLIGIIALLSLCAHLLTPPSLNEKISELRRILAQKSTKKSTPPDDTTASTAILRRSNSNTNTDSINTNNIDVKLPPGMIFQSKDQKDYLELYKCRDGGEAYSAAWLTTIEHLRYQKTQYNLSMVNSSHIFNVENVATILF